MKTSPKRANFTSIQQSAGCSGSGYTPTALRTGYEQVIAHRTNDLFAYTAKDKGVVIAVDDKHVQVEYANGKVVSTEIGRRFGTAAGTTIPHQIVTDLAVGDKVQPGDIVTWNSNFFSKDIFNPKQVLWRAGVTSKVAIFESTDTLEDSCVISDTLAAELKTGVSHVRVISLKFNQTVRNMVKLGNIVDSESILCTIEDPVTADNDLFSDAALSTLRDIGSLTPRAKYDGVIEKIEVFYNGEIEDMSESLRALTGSSDRYHAKMSKSLMKSTVITGRVDSSLRIDGNPLELDTLAIRVYITEEVPAGVGDKGVVANNLKSIIGRVMTGVNETESGAKLDALFSYVSISNRIVLSPEIIGTTTTLLRVISKRVAAKYRGTK